MIEVHRGTTRVVLLVGRWAVKLPRVSRAGGRLWTLARGVQANLSEREQASVPGVCPVRWSLLGVVNVYRRCDPVRGELSEADWSSIGYPGPVDRRPHNLGVLDGRLVLIDYDTSWSDCIACRRFGFETGQAT